jgi:hypothetical protein
METAVYSDFEYKKQKAKKKREIERSAERPSQRADAEPAVQPSAELDKSDEVMRLKVIRLPPNPRLLICAYQENGREHKVMVFVGRNGNFRPNMEISVRRPASESEPWRYAGRLPRFKGRW